MKYKVLATILALIIGLIAISILVLLLVRDRSSQSSVPSLQYDPVSYVLESVPSVESVKATVGHESVLSLEKYELELGDVDLPSFTKFERGVLKISPGKNDAGSYNVVFDSVQPNLIVNIDVEHTPVDLVNLEAELRIYLGSVLDQYGIYIYDLKREVTVGINDNVIFPPASSAKIVPAVLVLRDIDSGKYTLDTTYPIQAKYKHSDFDALGSLPNGTEVPISSYVTQLIVDSNNTAWYHLIHMLGDSYEVVNDRTFNELGVDSLYLDPYQGKTASLGKVFIDIYNGTTLSPTSQNFLIGLMKNAAPFNREGLGQGLPDGVEFANKLGYHWTSDLVNFVDTAIIWGKNTDYVVSVLNKNIDWVTGKNNLKNISEIIYRALDI